MLQTSRKRSILIKINKLYSEITSLNILPERKNNLKIIYATSLKKREGGSGFHQVKKKKEVKTWGLSAYNKLRKTKNKRKLYLPCLHSLIYTREGEKMWDSAVVQTQDKGESVHNFLEFFQPLVCLYQARQMQQKVFYCSYLSSSNLHCHSTLLFFQQGHLFFHLFQVLFLNRNRMTSVIKEYYMYL